MTRRRRRYRWLRDETVAPWVTLAIVLAMWWTGARLFGPEPIAGEPMRPRPAAPRQAPPPLEPGTGPLAPPIAAIAAGDQARPPAAPRKATPVPAPAAPIPPATREEITELRKRNLIMPVKDIAPEALHSDFDDKRGSRTHEALDILAPRGTAVRAVDDGTIARLFTSERGGLTIYQFDEDGRFCFYYAHLDRYASGLREGEEVDRGDTIGYVGTTGNAPENTPHLHFAIFKLGLEKRWWQGSPIDPYLVLR